MGRGPDQATALIAGTHCQSTMGNTIATMTIRRCDHSAHAISGAPTYWPRRLTLPPSAVGTRNVMMRTAA